MHKLTYTILTYTILYTHLHTTPGSLDGVHGDKGQLLTGEAVAEHLKSFKALFNEVCRVVCRVYI
jgi:hypothetical protein